MRQGIWEPFGLLSKDIENGVTGLWVQRFAVQTNVVKNAFSGPRAEPEMLRL